MRGKREKKKQKREKQKERKERYVNPNHCSQQWSHKAFGSLLDIWGGRANEGKIKREKQKERKERKKIYKEW